MIIFFVILVVVFCLALGFIVLVQNPKGGGLSGSIAGFSNQFMGVKQTNDVLEKGTWILSIIIALLCIFSAAFIPKGATGSNLVNELDTKPKATQSAPAQQPAPAPAPVPVPNK
ncbi:MAG: preprotein translocase subunit SecG [Chitinophagaceae bacterium]